MKVLLPLAFLLATGAADGGGLDAGRKLYQFMEAPAPVSAQLAGDDSLTLAAARPCASCHGFDGGGDASLGAPPLARLAAAAQDAGAFQKALTGGIAPDGRVMRTMPRYALSSAQRRDLASYLIALNQGTAPEPGTDGDVIAIDLSSLSPSAAAALAKAGSGQSVYGRQVRYGRFPVPFARVVAKASTTADSLIPAIVACPPSATSGERTAERIAELLGRAGRRLSRPSFAALAAHEAEGEDPCSAA